MCAVALVAGAVVTGVGAEPASAHGYCQTHNILQLGTKAWGSLASAVKVEGVRGHVQVPFANEVKFKTGQLADPDGSPIGGYQYFTAAMLSLDNFKLSSDVSADEVSVGWYMGTPQTAGGHFPGGELPWAHGPTWFVRETYFANGTVQYRYEVLNEGRTIAGGYHEVVIMRQNSSPTNPYTERYDIAIDGVRVTSTVYRHQTGLMPTARGEVHGFPCVEMWSVWRWPNSTGPSAATLRYKKYDSSGWYYFPYHVQRIFTLDPITGTNYEGPYGNASCFREQTIGHVATSYSYGPLDDGPGGYCPVPYT